MFWKVFKITIVGVVCCLIGFGTIQAVRVKGVKDRILNAGISPSANVLLDYYRALSEQDLNQAYAHLSRPLQKKIPFKRFKALAAQIGFAEVFDICEVPARPIEGNAAAYEVFLKITNAKKKADEYWKGLIPMVRENGVYKIMTLGDLTQVKNFKWEPSYWSYWLGREYKIGPAVAVAMRPSVGLERGSGVAEVSKPSSPSYPVSQAALSASDAANLPSFVESQAPRREIPNPRSESQQGPYEAHISRVESQPGRAESPPTPSPPPQSDMAGRSLGQDVKDYVGTTGSVVKMGAQIMRDDPARTADRLMNDPAYGERLEKTVDNWSKASERMEERMDKASNRLENAGKAISERFRKK